VAKKFAVSLNDNDAEEHTWIVGIESSGMLPAHLLKEALRAYFGTTREVQARATNDDVVAWLEALVSHTQAMHEATVSGFATLADRLQNISVVQASSASQSATDEEIRLQEVEEARAQIPEAVNLAMTYASKKPGMRLES